MREMPYIQPYHVGNRRGGNQNILDEFREFLDARGGRGGRSGRGGMRNRIGYDTYDTYGRSTNKAHEICERYKEILPNDVEPCDVYVAINAQYHDYAKLFEEWFGGNIDNKVFESAITFWFKDVDFDGDKVWEYFHMNN